MAGRDEVGVEPPVASAARPNDEIDLHGIVRMIWRGRLWVLASMLVFGGLAATHAYVSKPRYRSEALLSVRTPTELSGSAAGLLQGQLGGLASLVGLGSGGSGSRQEFVAFLKSRELAREFVTRYQLMQVFYGDPKAAAPGKRAPSVSDAVDYLGNLRSVDEDARTGLLSISFIWVDPKLAARWVNDYVALANEQLRAEAIAEGQKSVQYLNDELTRTALEPVRQSLYRLMEGRLNQVMLANIEHDYAFHVIDRAEPPEPENFFRPRRRIEIFLGSMFGILLGVVWVLWRSTRPGAERV